MPAGSFRHTDGAWVSLRAAPFHISAKFVALVGTTNTTNTTNAGDGAADAGNTMTFNVTSAVVHVYAPQSIGADDVVSLATGVASCKMVSESTSEQLRLAGGSAELWAVDVEFAYQPWRRLEYVCNTPNVVGATGGTVTFVAEATPGERGVVHSNVGIGRMPKLGVEDGSCINFESANFVSEACRQRASAWCVLIASTLLGHRGLQQLQI